MATLTSSLIVRLVDQVTAPARKMSSTLLGLNNAVGSNFGSRLSNAIERNNRALDSARGRLLDATAGAFVLKRGFDATAGAAMALEDKMADIAKVSGMDPTQLQEFETILRGLATKDIPLAVEELAELAAAASQSGIANEDLEEFTTMAAKTAVAWDMSGGQVGEALAKIKTALGMSIAETRAYGDAINYLSDTTASSASDLVEFSSRVAADGKVAGFSNEEVLALGATMISMGAQADVAATSLRNVGRMLSRGDFGAKKSQLDAFKQLGLDAEKVAKAMQIDASGTLLEVLEQVNKAAPHQKLALMSGIFGDEARALMPLLTELEQTRVALEGVADETNYLGSVQKEFETRSKTGSYAIQRFKNQLRDVAIVIGKSLLPGMKLMLEAIAPYIANISSLLEQHPKLTAAIFATASGLVAFRIAAAALSFVGLLGRGGALSMISLGFNTVGKAALAARAAIAGQLGLQAALAGGLNYSPMQKLADVAKALVRVTPGLNLIGPAFTAIGGALSLPVLAAIAAVGGAGLLIWKYWDRLSSIFSGVGRAIGEQLAPAIEAAKPMLEFLKPIGETIASGWDKATAAIQAFGNWIGSFFQQEVLTEEDKAKFEQAGYDAATRMIDAVKTKVNELVEWFRDLGARIKAAVGQIVIDVGSTLTGPASAVLNGGANALGIPSKITEPVQGSGGNTIYPVGQAPSGHRATGGPVWPGGSFLVGERGRPEIFTPRTAGTITPVGGRGGRSGGGVGDVTINIHDARDPEATSRAVRRELEDLFDGAHTDSGAWD